MPQPLWTPSSQRMATSNLRRFLAQVNEEHGTSFTDYHGLYVWSVENIPRFWAALWRFVSIIHSRPWEEVVDDQMKMPGAKWFSGARLNFAENLLRFRDSQVALICRAEDGRRRTLTYEELYAAVATVARGLREAGVGPGDRVVGYMPNIPETVVAMLAATSLGAIWSSCSPDFGSKGVLDRFGQTRPKVLFAADGYVFKGKPVDCLDKVAAIARQIPEVAKVVVIPYLRQEFDLSAIPAAVHWGSFIAGGPANLDFTQLPFDHPLYIMYSSGTTGLPKCMVQSGGGVLLNQLKELVLHTDLKRSDTIFYYTTCGWMMWNWLVASLAVGATVVLYEGSPFHPAPDALWRMAEEEGVTVFGTSAGYIAALKRSGFVPATSCRLDALRTILSTGSPLSKEDFRYVYHDVKSDLQLASISGGSDLNGCFALGNPLSPVYEGELQCRGLGMKVFAYDDRGQPVIGQRGELVCAAAFPSMPVAFWDDADGSKYRNAYFTRFPGVWSHGDYIEITEHQGVIIYGRSDATLNPGGVRIGTAEIYRLVERIEEIADSVVVGQEWQNDTRIVLFVVMRDGFTLTDELRRRIVNEVRNGASPRHVPAKIIAVPDIPYTLNMKKVELAVQKVIHGKEVRNIDSLKNPNALNNFVDLEELNT